MPTRRSLVLLATAIGGGALPATESSARAGLPAPEFSGLQNWMNTAAVPSIAGLRGKPVLLHFWTYSCINWHRTAPYLKRWHAEYGASGLQSIGIHTPEFGFEHDRRNFETSVRELGILYPVAQDNGYRTWRAWNNRAWPAFYLLDRDGRITLIREGEGHAREMESAIRSLLGLPQGSGMVGAGDDADLSRIGTPEIYFGALHPTPQDRAQGPRRGEATYAFREAAGLSLNQYQLDGRWSREDEALVLRSPKGGLRLRFSAAKLHLVAAAPKAAPLLVSLDGGRPRPITINFPTLYTVLDGEAYGEHMIEVTTEAPGLSLYSATFG